MMIAQYIATVTMVEVCKEAFCAFRTSREVIIKVHEKKRTDAAKVPTTGDPMPQSNIPYFL